MSKICDHKNNNTRLEEELIGNSIQSEFFNSYKSVENLSFDMVRLFHKEVGVDGMVTEMI